MIYPTNPKTCTFDTRDWIKGGSVLIVNVTAHIVDATQVPLCKIFLVGVGEHETKNDRYMDDILSKVDGCQIHGLKH